MCVLPVFGVVSLVLDRCRRDVLCRIASRHSLKINKCPLLPSYILRSSLSHSTIFARLALTVATVPAILVWRVNALLSTETPCLMYPFTMRTQVIYYISLKLRFTNTMNLIFITYGVIHIKMIFCLPVILFVYFFPTVNSSFSCKPCPYRPIYFFRIWLTGSNNLLSDFLFSQNSISY